MDTTRRRLLGVATVLGLTEHHGALENRGILRTLIRSVAAAAFAALAVVGPGVATASAEGAVLERFSFTTTETFDGALPECFDETLVGTNINTETVSGKSVETQSGVVSVSGTNVLTYRVDFPNGDYATGGGTTKFLFSGREGGTAVSTDQDIETRTVYAADGTPIVSVRLHALTHFTFHDRNSDGVPQPGEISADIDRFSFTCH